MAAVMHVIIGIVDQPRRWEWWFFSANDLGITMAAVLCLCIGAMGLVSDFLRRWRVPLVMVCAAVAITAGTALVASCSRGGWAALLAGATLMALCCRHTPLRQAALVVCLAVMVAIPLTPKAQARASTMLAPLEDGSIQCRMEMWFGASALIADQPLSGCGAGQFGAINENWYLPRYRGIHLFHALNDTLFLGAERGLLAAYLYLAGLLSAIAALAWLGFRRMDRVAASFAGGLTAFLVGGMFTSLLVGGAAVWIGGFAVAAMVHLLRSPDRRQSLTRGVLVGAVGAAIVAVTILLIGARNADSLPYRPERGALLAAGPRHQEPRATVIVLRSPADTDREVSEHVLRHLAGAGFRTVAPAVGAETLSYEPVDHPVILLALHGASELARRHWSDLPDGAKPVAVIFLDAPPPAADHNYLPPCPILWCDGAQAGRRVSNEALEALLTRQPGSRHLVVAPAVLWPRYYRTIHDAVVAWIAVTLTNSRPGAADDK